MNHEINLTGYTASCNAADNMLCLGTAGSYGLEKLHVTADAAWDGLTITATFTNSGSTTVAVTGGAVDVPPEATRMPTRDRVRYGQIAFKGADADGSIRLISTPVYYKVQASSATDGENTIAPTPDQYAQFVAEVTAEADRAEAAANRAESAGSTVTPEQIAEAVNNYLTENPVQATPIDATLTQSGQAADAAAVGNRLSALSEEIAAIPSGADGKSAYQYAQDGGYTGTETEFAAKLAQEKFANPNALTLTGAVSATYDGSAPVSVEIPSGGGGGSGGSGKAKSQILINQEITELTASLSVTLEHDFHNLIAIINCGSAGAALTAGSDGTAVVSKIGLIIDSTDFGWNSRKVAYMDTSTGTWKSIMFGAEWSDDLSVFKRGFGVNIGTGTSKNYYDLSFGGTSAMYGTLGTEDNAPRTGKTANIVVNGAYLNVGTRVILWGEYYE
ncbi:MAG: hypothetical protein PUK20_03995 [Firmicutes bacterium]|nr:hypothetical protein [Bacillota bacterium]MDY4106808.1 hypothetical protein [Oscillospiraceae bacterium]